VPGGSAIGPGFGNIDSIVLVCSHNGRCFYSTFPGCRALERDSHFIRRDLWIYTTAMVCPDKEDTLDVRVRSRISWRQIGGASVPGNGIY